MPFPRWIQRLRYERRVALAERGWSLLGLAVGSVLLLAGSDPWSRATVWVFLSEPLPALLAGFLASRLILNDAFQGLLPFLLTRQSAVRLWVLRFGLLASLIAWLLAWEWGVARYFSPEPRPYLPYLPLSGLVASLFFAAAASSLALWTRRPTTGDMFTLMWGLASLLLVFPSRYLHQTGIGPFFPFPVWFLHRRLTTFPDLAPLLQPAQRLPQHWLVLGLLTLGLLVAHPWLLRRLQQHGY